MGADQLELFRFFRVFNGLAKGPMQTLEINEGAHGMCCFRNPWRMLENRADPFNKFFQRLLIQFCEGRFLVHLRRYLKLFRSIRNVGEAVCQVWSLALGLRLVSWKF